MQHAALDSIANSPQLTGTPFPSVSSSPQSPNRYKVNTTQSGQIASSESDESVDLHLVAIRRFRRVRVNAKRLGASDASWVGDANNLLDNKFHLNLCRRTIQRHIAPGCAGHLGEALAHA